jgi:hypothetical protein
MVIDPFQLAQNYIDTPPPRDLEGLVESPLSEL